MLNYKDYTQIQITEDMKCTCCNYVVIAGSNAWVTPYPKKDGMLCSSCWDKKRQGLESVNPVPLPTPDEPSDMEILKGIVQRTKVSNSLSPSREISIVITKLEEALMWLNKKNERK